MEAGRSDEAAGPACRRAAPHSTARSASRASLRCTRPAAPCGTRKSRHAGHAPRRRPRRRPRDTAAALSAAAAARSAAPLAHLARGAAALPHARRVCADATRWAQRKAPCDGGCAFWALLALRAGISGADARSRRCRLCARGASGRARAAASTGDAAARGASPGRLAQPRAGAAARAAGLGRAAQPEPGQQPTDTPAGAPRSLTRRRALKRRARRLTRLSHAPLHRLPSATWRSWRTSTWRATSSLRSPQRSVRTDRAAHSVLSWSY